MFSIFRLQNWFKRKNAIMSALMVTCENDFLSDFTEKFLAILIYEKKTLLRCLHKFRYESIGGLWWSGSCHTRISRAPEIVSLLTFHTYFYFTEKLQEIIW